MARNTLTDYNSVEALQEMAGHYNIEVKDVALYEMVAPAIAWGIDQFKYGKYIDFVDQLFMPYILSIDCEKFDFIMVDEAQDLNRLQHWMLKASSHKDTRVIFVGDPMQSMYGFAGALTNSLQLLKELLTAKEYSLPICYRCPTSHIQIAQWFDKGRTKAHPNAIAGKVEFILQSEIYSRVTPGALILCRLTAPLVGVCIRLISKNIQAKVLGREIGGQLIKLVEGSMEVDGHDDRPDWTAFPDRLRAYVNVIRDKLTRQQNTESQVELLNDKEECIMTCYSSPEFNTKDMRSFTSAIEKLFDDGSSAITLCTVHKAKGLEAKDVFIIADAKGRDIIPLIRKNQKQSDLDQEINIGYVATTRSKENMYICSHTKEASDRHRDFFLNGGIRRFFSKDSVTETPKTSPPPAPVITVTPIPDVPSVTEFKIKSSDAPATPPGVEQMELIPRKKMKKKVKLVTRVLID
jgi:hypothetical protein